MDVRTAEEKKQHNTEWKGTTWD